MSDWNKSPSVIGKKNKNSINNTHTQWQVNNFFFETILIHKPTPSNPEIYSDKMSSH